MPSPPNITNIPAPRVPIIDERTGLVSREWYRFFFNLFNLAGGGSSDASLQDLLVGPPVGFDEQVELNQNIGGLLASPNGSAQESQIAELQKQFEGLAVQEPSLISQIAQVQAQLDALKLQVYPALGSMAPLQQDNLPWVTFDTTPEHVPSTTTGTLYWGNDDNNKTLNLVMENAGGIVQRIGEDSYYRVKADSPISAGQVVMLTGTLGASGGLRAAPATGLTAFQGESILGVAVQSIANNAWGYVLWFGEIKNISATGSLYGETWADGDILYYNPSFAGGLTKSVPTAPNPKVIVAVVIHAAVNGVLFVRPTFGSALGDTDSNVEITSVANNDLLQYKAANSRWENVTFGSVISGAWGAPVTKTADFAVAANETWIINNKAGSTCTVTLPSAATTAGRFLVFQNYQAQFLVSASSNVVPLGGGAAGTAILENAVGNWATMVSDGTNWIIMQDAPNNALLLE